MRIAVSSSVRAIIFAGLLITALGCRSSEEVPKESTPIDPATAGKIRVTVSYRGAVPQPKQVDMQSAPRCAEAHSAPVFDDRLLVSDGKVQNAVVWIKSGLEKYQFAPPQSAATLDQHGCLYTPRVLAAMTHQKITFTNSDPEAHNVHGEPKIVSSFNFIISRKGASREVTFDKAEVGIPVTCDIHPWMRAFLAIIPNPYFAVTPASGAVELSNVPPGDYVLGIWQERAGAIEEKVHLDPSGIAEVNVTLPAAQ